MFNKRSIGSTHSSHGNLSQASITSCDVLSGDEVDSPLQGPAKIRERRSNSSTDIQGAHSGCFFTNMDVQYLKKLMIPKPTIIVAEGWTHLSVSLREPSRDLPCVLSHGNVFITEIQTAVCCLVVMRREYLCDHMSLK